MFSDKVGAGPAGNQPLQAGQMPVAPMQNDDSFAKPSKPKKPFYKKWWFWVIAAVVVIGIGSALSNGSNGNKAADTTNTAGKSSGTSNSSKSATTNKNSSSSESAKKLTQEIYDNLKSAATNIDGSGKITYSGGSTYADLVKQIGEPSSTSEVSVGDATDVTATWSDLSYSFSSGSKFVVLTVTYDKASDQIISKSMTNF